MSSSTNLASNAAYRCMSIKEIQCIILEYLRLDSQGFKSLSELAVTCTLFKEVALDAIWHDRTTIVPLVKVMPADLWAIESSILEGVTQASSIHFTRAIEHSDWSRFDYYSPRIVRFGSISDPSYRKLPIDSIQVHESVLIALCAYRPAHPLLTNLRTISLNTDMTRSARFVPIVFGASITSFTIREFSEVLVAELPGLLSSITRLCPNLQDLTLFPTMQNFPPHSEGLQNRLASALEALTSSLTSLQELFIAIPFPANAIRNLGRLARLRSWKSINLTSGISAHETRNLFTTTNGCFPELSVIILRAPDLDYAANVIQRLQRPLKFLHVSARNRPSNAPSLILTFAKSFLGHASTSSLTVLRLDIFGVEFEDQDISSAFQPFFSLNNLIEFSMVNSCVAKLDNAWFAAAANAWPHLQTLWLRSHGLPPRATLSGLIPIIQCCPDLRTLRLTICVKPFRLELPKVCNTKITSINFLRSSIENPVGVFRCLTSMFPNLREVKVTGNDDGWKRVSALLEESNLDAYPEQSG